MSYMSNAYEGSPITESEEDELLREVRREVRFVTKKVACIHRLKSGDIPRGLDPDDVALACQDDPRCPRRNKSPRRT